MCDYSRFMRIGQGSVMAREGEQKYFTTKTAKTAKKRGRGEGKVRHPLPLYRDEWNYEPTVGAVMVIGWLKLAKSVVVLRVMLPCPSAPMFERVTTLAIR